MISKATSALQLYTTLGNGRYTEVPDGNLIPKKRPKNLSRSNLIDQLASRDLPSWDDEWKRTAPTIVAAKAFKGELVQDYLVNEAKAHRKVGSSSPIHHGDLDFALHILATILFQNVSDGAKKRVAEDLIYLDTNDFLSATPKTLGLIRETENHTLMTECSRLLKAKYLGESYPTDQLCEFLDSILKGGIFEFNSLPYENVTISSLLIMATYGPEKIKKKATKILDRIFWRFALGSINFKSIRPFRRSRGKQHGKYWMWPKFPMKVFADRAGMQGDHEVSHISRWRSASFASAISSYCPPKKAIEWTIENPGRYEALVGHGKYGSPEIYSAGKGWLLSGGGTSLGNWILENAPRPTTLVTPQTQNLDDSFHIKGPSDDDLGWNNTGVSNGVAVVKDGRLSVPDRQRPKRVESDNIKVYEEPAGDGTVEVFTYNKDDVAAVCVSRNADSHRFEVRRDKVMKPNGETVEFDLHGDPTRPIIKSHPNSFEEFPKVKVDEKF